MSYTEEDRAKKLKCASIISVPISFVLVLILVVITPKGLGATFWFLANVVIYVGNAAIVRFLAINFNGRMPHRS